MRLIDLSQPLFDGSPNCPVHPPVKVDIIADHVPNNWRVELLTIASHTGSHVDAPYHKFSSGKNLDGIPLDHFTGLAHIVDLRSVLASTPITASMFQEKLPNTLEDRIILLATGWGDKRAKTQEWLYESPHLNEEGATWLVERKIRAVGIDHYSISGSQEPTNTNVHEILLGANIWIVEELKFPPEAFAIQQPCPFMALPINLKTGTGMFCRPVLILEMDK